MRNLMLDVFENACIILLYSRNTIWAEPLAKLELQIFHLNVIYGLKNTKILIVYY
ncbi:hypothetical protein ACJX0J_036363, partial [Zea mays]